jgi:tartrate/fumarate subfamily iron-sulfur-dependent hydro-lyase beta chain
MTDTILNLDLPLAEDKARSLELGRMVTVSGLLFTGRSRFHIRAIEDDILPPLDFGSVNGFFHVGPVMRQVDDAWEVVSIEPTSSIRFERYSGAVIRKLGLRTVIGKTTMGPDSIAALKDVGGVYLSKIGLCGNSLAARVKAVREVHFLEALGKTEATWVFHVERFGPFFVAIDAHGNHYFDELEREVGARLAPAEQALGIPPGFEFTNVRGAAPAGEADS